MESTVIELPVLEAFEKIMQENGLSKCQLAKLLKVTPITIYSWYKKEDAEIKLRPKTAWIVYKKFNILVKPYKLEILAELNNETL